MQTDDLKRFGDDYIQWLFLGIVLADRKLLRDVKPEWWTQPLLSEVVSEAQKRLKEKNHPLPKLTELLRHLGALSWKFDGTIDSVSTAKERMDDRMEANHMYLEARKMVCGWFDVPGWALEREWDWVRTTEEKVDVVARVLKLKP